MSFTYVNPHNPEPIQPTFEIDAGASSVVPSLELQTEKVEKVHIILFRLSLLNCFS